MNKKPFIVLPTEHGKEVIYPDEIISISSNSKNVIISLDGKLQMEAKLGMANIFQLLDQQFFIRSHRTCIVNISKVRKIHGSYNSLQLTDGINRPIARASKNQVKKLFEHYHQLCINTT